MSDTSAGSSQVAGVVLAAGEGRRFGGTESPLRARGPTPGGPLFVILSAWEKTRPRCRGHREPRLGRGDGFLASHRLEVGECHDRCRPRLDHIGGSARLDPRALAPAPPGSGRFLVGHFRRGTLVPQGFLPRGP
jgi:hypothetical protein